MKRDIDLCRQILLDLEAKGSDCATSLLRSDVIRETDQRVRYHIRLLIDAGLVREVERTNGSTTTCVRLTNSGHEFLDVSRIETVWQDAKSLILNCTGGLSLAVLRAVLTKWAVEAVATPQRRARRVARPSNNRYPHTVEHEYHDRDVLRDERDGYVNEDFSVVRTRPDYRERFDSRETVTEINGYGYTTESLESSVGVTLPIYMV